MPGNRKFTYSVETTDDGEGKGHGGKGASTEGTDTLFEQKKANLLGSKRLMETKTLKKRATRNVIYGRFSGVQRGKQQSGGGIRGRGGGR